MTTLSDDNTAPHWAGLLEQSQMNRLENLKRKQEVEIAVMNEQRKYEGVFTGSKPTGGPSSYYDFPEEFKTVNDVLEDKSEHQWGIHSWHLANIFKAVWRFGTKEGTSHEYDVKKVIYSACRVLRRMSGNEAMRKYLQELLDDQQFKS